MIDNLKKHNYLYLSIGSTILMIFYLVFFLNKYSKSFIVEVGINSLGLTFFYTYEIVKDFFESRTLEQLFYYRRFLQIWDPIFAISYTVMYSSWIIYFFTNKYYLLVLPLLVMIIDWLENYIELIMLESFINSDILSPTLVLLGASINALRWLLFSAIYLLIIVGIIKGIKNYYAKR
mgnify:CR=1 FL=1